MNFVRTYNLLIALFLIAIYLALPATSLAYAFDQEASVFSALVTCSVENAAPCGSCPCSDGNGSGCCDSTFCNCACHAPLAQGTQLTYAPVIAMQKFRETSWKLPQVYRTIFVPPQNHA